jgi:hypothetical protein
VPVVTVPDSGAGTRVPDAEPDTVNAAVVPVTVPSVTLIEWLPVVGIVTVIDQPVAVTPVTGDGDPLSTEYVNDGAVV